MSFFQFVLCANRAKGEAGMRPESIRCVHFNVLLIFAFKKLHSLISAKIILLIKFSQTIQEETYRVGGSSPLSCMNPWPSCNISSIGMGAKYWSHKLH